MSHTAEEIELARKIASHAEANPESLDMETWIEDPSLSCGTTACIGGWAVILHDGWEAIWFSEGGEPSVVRSPGAGHEMVSNRAATLLGLVSNEEWDMFYASPEEVEAAGGVRAFMSQCMGVEL